MKEDPSELNLLNLHIFPVDFRIRESVIMSDLTHARVEPLAWDGCVRGVDEMSKLSCLQPFSSPVWYQRRFTPSQVHLDQVVHE